MESMEGDEGLIEKEKKRIMTRKKQRKWKRVEAEG
jgi:hypothetical protein